MIRLRGHLLDTGLINRMLDRIVEGGGSFQVLDFALGQPRYGPSRATIKVSTPNAKVMEDLMARLIDLGAEASEEEEHNATLADTEMDLINAQSAYAQALQGAGMVLMLSSMLHSIGVGNMTSAGVKLVCVDSNRRW
jgi:hypothetical protein